MLDLPPLATDIALALIGIAMTVTTLVVTRTSEAGPKQRLTRAAIVLFPLHLGLIVLGRMQQSHREQVFQEQMLSVIGDEGTVGHLRGQLAALREASQAVFAGRRKFDDLLDQAEQLDLDGLDDPETLSSHAESILRLMRLGIDAHAKWVDQWAGNGVGAELDGLRDAIALHRDRLTRLEALVAETKTDQDADAKTWRLVLVKGSNRLNSTADHLAQSIALFSEKLLASQEQRAAENKKTILKGSGAQEAGE